MTTTRDSASPIDAADEELIDTLIAISVVAKRLAAKLRQSNENPKESEDGKSCFPLNYICALLFGCIIQLKPFTISHSTTSLISAPQYIQYGYSTYSSTLL